MNPREEEQDFLDKRFGDEPCDDCNEGPDGHNVGLNPSGQFFAECDND